MGERSSRATGLLALSGVLSLALLAGLAQAEPPDAATVAAEARQLEARSSSASRHGQTLQPRASNGRVVRLDSHTDDEAHPESFVDYRFAGTSSDSKFFSVHAMFYEHETTYWISRATGETTEVFAAPVISPDGSHAVTALAWETFGPEGVFVWEIAGDRLVQQAHIRHGNFGLFTFKRWTDDHTAVLELFSHDYLAFCPGTNSTTADIRLSAGSTGWALLAPSAKDVRCS